MERAHSTSRSRCHSLSQCQQHQAHIVDEPSSSSHSLLHWLRRQFRYIQPCNNFYFNPTPSIS